MREIRLTKVIFSDYKALGRYSLTLDHLNILVGPNNCGKSTVIGAFRVLGLTRFRGRVGYAAALRSNSAGLI